MKAESFLKGPRGSQPLPHLAPTAFPGEAFQCPVCPSGYRRLKSFKMSSCSKWQPINTGSSMINHLDTGSRL